MSNQIHQLTPQACRTCSQPGVFPRTEVSFDYRTRETITEAVWICHRCGSKFASGEVSRVKQNENT